MIKHLSVCADDYGQTMPISQAILALIAQKRLTAVSCMVTGNDWAEHAALLKPLIGQVDIGLHFNLTHLAPLSLLYREHHGDCFPSLGQLLIKSHLRLVNQAAIQAEFAAQWQRFQETLGKTPDMIDGHQHVHQFPIIRDAMMAFLLQQPTPRPLVRLVKPTIFTRGSSILKNTIITLSGACGLKARLIKHHMRFNQSFTGIYDFSKAAHYRTYAQRFLSDIKDGGLMMCHPGLANSQEAWPLSFSRPLEYAYLASDAFLDDLARAEINLKRNNEF